MRGTIWNVHSLLFQPGRDDDLAFRFGWERGVGATLHLALTCGRSATSDVRLRLGAETRTAGLSHIGTHANGNMHAALFELMRGGLSDAARTLSNSREPRENTICRRGGRSGSFSGRGGS